MLDSISFIVSHMNVPSCGYHPPLTVTTPTEMSRPRPHHVYGQLPRTLQYTLSQYQTFPDVLFMSSGDFGGALVVAAIAPNFAGTQDLTCAFIRNWCFINGHTALTIFIWSHCVLSQEFKATLFDHHRRWRTSLLGTPLTCEVAGEQNEGEGWPERECDRDE
jgi:hypothetical protein